MEESGSHQPTVGPHQDNDNLHQAASGGSQHSYSEVNPQQRRDREQSGQTMRTNRSQSRGKSHVSHAKNEKEMQREITELKKKLRRAQRKRVSLEFESSSGDTEDIGKDLKLRPVRPSLAMKSTVITSGRAKVPCIRA